MDNRLSTYNKKRDFNKTREPQGIKRLEENELKYVIQHHIARRDHYDLRLEWEGAMLSWAVPKGVSLDPKERRLSVRVEDHPIEYRNFEGTIPKGEYGGGTVMIWDEGYWRPLTDVKKGLEQGSLKFEIDGIRLKGKWALVRMDDRGDGKDNWLLIKEKDGFAATGVSPEFDSSVRTGRTMDEITRGEEKSFSKNPFDKTEAQLAKLSTEIPKGSEWVFEVKYDGYRILAYIEGNTVKLKTRNNLDYTGHFKDVADSLIRLAGGRAMVLDGEMVVTDENGRSDFSALQSYMKSPKGKNLIYIVFDLLALDGEDLRGKKLTERKKMLAGLMENAPGNIHYSRHVEGRGEESFKAACNAGMEGIVGKKADSTYKGARNGDWIKIKCRNIQEFVVGGYTLSDKKTSGVSSLLLGYYDNGKLVFVGRAGSGISERAGKDLEKKFKDIITDKPPFEAPPKPAGKEKFFWVKPEYVAQVRFAEFTADNLLRQASYKGIRADKAPEEVALESPEPLMAEKPVNKDKTEAPKAEELLKQIKITNPDRVVFTKGGITKLDVIKYYAEIAPYMLPYIEKRLLSVVRCPKGAVGECFFKKHPGPGSKAIVTMPADEDKENYFYIENALGLVNEAQMGTLEFHTWGSRADRLENPDIMVFDLDPDEGMDLKRVRQGVKDLKSLLDELKLTSYLKTSGGKGYHIVIPFEPYDSWDTFYEFAKRVALVMENRWPDRYTSNSRKAKRAGKIFIDWIRNGRGATSVAPYSLRAREGAKVSMPIFWYELDTVAPDGIDIKEALKRVKGRDPWKGFFE